MKNASWFTVKQVITNIWGIGEFNHPEKVISYLIVGQKKALLWDTGLGVQNIADVIEHITKHPITVINSHSHYDHVGGNILFRKFIPSKQKTIRLTPFRFKVIKTPGHSSDSVCLYEDNLGYLFSGDTLYDGPIYLHLPESNIEDYKKTINSLLLLPKITEVFPSHNSFRFSKANLTKIKKAIKRITKINNKSKIMVTNKLSILL